MYQFIDDIRRTGIGIAKLTTQFQLGSPTPQRFYRFALHARIVELASTVGALVQSHDVVAIPHIVRGQLEAYIDFINLDQNASYVDDMELTRARKARTVLRESVKLGATPVANPAAVLATMDTHVHSLEQKGAKDHNIETRFQMANLQMQYRSAYAYLCTHAHNTLTALEERHLDATKTPPQLLIASDKIDQSWAALIEISLRIPMETLVMLMPHHTGVAASDLTALQADLTNTRQAWAQLV